MNDTQTLLSEFEAAATEMEVSPTTLGRLVNQGGHFHRRLKENRRMWPDTIERVRADLRRLVAERAPSGDAA